MEQINYSDFFENYNPENFSIYYNDSLLIFDLEDRIEFWENQILKYNKDAINLDFAGALKKSIDLKLNIPESFFGDDFGKLCLKQIELIKLDLESQKKFNMRNLKSTNILTAIKVINAKLNFESLLPDFSNIDEVYSNNLNVWYVNNSDAKETKNGNEIVISNGVLENPDNVFFSKSQNGFELSEVDFIEAEIDKLIIINFNNLTLSQQKQFKFYNEYLSKKKAQVNWTLNDYFNHYIKTKEYKNFGFVYPNTYKSTESEKLKARLSEYKEQYDYIFEKLNDIKDIKQLWNGFNDNLSKLKNKQNVRLNEVLIEDLILKINSDYNKKVIDIEHSIIDFKNAISNDFEIVLKKNNEDGSMNPLYYYNFLNAEETRRYNDINEKEYLQNHKRLLLIFNRRITILNINVIKMFKAFNDYNENRASILNKIRLIKIEVEITLNVIKNYKLSIQYLCSIGKDEEAIKLKNYIVNVYERSLSYLINGFLGIYLKNTPIYNQFDEVLIELKNSIDIQELNILSKQKTLQNSQASKPKKLKKNLLEFIYNIENKKAFLDELKSTFPTEKGKSIKAIVLKLIEVEILIYGTKEFRQFFNELEAFFKRDIGTYQSINDVKTVDKETNITIYKKLIPLINKHKSF